MGLAHVASLLLWQFACGTLLFGALFWLPALRHSYYWINGLLAAVGLALGACLAPPAGLRLVIWLIALLTALGVVVAMYHDLRRSARVPQGVAGVAALVLLAEVAPGTEMFLGITLGALLLGFANAAMLLGHSYLTSKGLAFVHLQRACLILVGLVLLRSACLGAILVQHWDTPVVADLFDVQGNALFFLMRVFWGLAGPLVLAFLAYRCAAIKSNQSATGILYVNEVFVIIGELCAGFLQQRMHLPI